ncbi:MAG: two-component sensor histidine kinase [Clostridiales bacterium]|nr:two-component sensor histidine kinase [Clostridiales bacterium]
MARKVNYRLFLTALIAMLLAALTASLLYYRAFTIQVWEDAEQLVRAYAVAYEQSPDTFDQACADAEIRLTLIDPEGSVLYDSVAEGTLENHSLRPEVEEALANGSGSSERMSSTLSQRTFYEAVLLSDGNVLRVSLDVASIYSVFLQALPWLLLALAVMTLISVWVSRRLTRSLVDPIVEMGRHLDDVEDHVPYPELAPLGKTLMEDRVLRENHEKIRQEFTANVSHELKTPLTSISGYAELMASGMVSQEDIPSFAAQIQKESARMIALVSDIIKLTELDSGALQTEDPPEMEPVDLQAVAQASAERLRVRAQRAYVTISVAGESVTVSGVQNLLEELCDNLVENAVRYNRPGGRVLLTTGLREGQPFLQVRDSGIGIPKEAQSRVFERFYRVDKSRSKATGGTGLGLAIVKHIALLHNAAIDLESQVGEGTEMTVCFPKPSQTAENEGKISNPA